MSRKSYNLLLFLVAFTLFVPVRAFAVPYFTISSPAADGVFVLTGEQMNGVAGMDISIAFDGSKLNAPHFAAGPLVGGMLSASNDVKNLNPLKIAIVGTSGITGSGSGVVATITFERLGASPGSITSITGRLIDAHGKYLKLGAPKISNPPEPAAPAATGGSGGSGGSGTTTNTENGSGPATDGTYHPNMVGGTITLPTDALEGGEKNTSETKTSQSENQEPQQADRYGTSAPAEQEQNVKEAEPAPTPKTAPKPIQSVLEKFRLYQGEMSVEALTALFKNDPAAQYHQLPPIAVADGKSKVTLVIAVPTGEKTPNFAFTSAKYVGVSRTEGGWEVEVKPEKGAATSTVTMVFNGYSQDFPLTVVPKAGLVTGKPRPAKESDFKAFMKERGTEAAPKGDMNKDGKRDYIDDYIYTGNYLVQMEEQAKKKEKEKEKEKAAK